jgi:hypothetical protein
VCERSTWQQLCRSHSLQHPRSVGVASENLCVQVSGLVLNPAVLTVIVCRMNNDGN